jgi:hypothetical protein
MFSRAGLHPMKLVRIIKMYLNEKCSTVHRWTSVWRISYLEWSETRRCFIAVAFKFYFGISHQKGPSKLGKLNGIHQLLVHTNDFNILADNRNTMRRNREALLETRREVGIEYTQSKLSILTYPDNKMEDNRTSYWLLIYPLKCGNIQIFWRYTSISKLHSRRN